MTIVTRRGRLQNKATDEYNQTLPAPRILNVEPEKGYYSKPVQKGNITSETAGEYRFLNYYSFCSLFRLHTTKNEKIHQ